jgi:hypothetical protein
MTTEKEKLHAEDELSFIKKVMEDSRRYTIDNGVGFILWGILGVIGMGVIFAGGIMGFEVNALYLWLAIFLIGFAITYFTSRRESRVCKVSTFAGRMLGAVWIGCLLTVFMIFFIPFFFPDVPGRLLTSVIVLVIGAGYFISSFIFNYRWIMYNAFAWWAGAFVIMIFKIPYFGLIVLSVLFIFFQVVPGMVLYNKWKKELAPVNE